MRYSEKDMGNYTGLTSRVYDVENREHMKELVEIITNRPVHFKTYKGYQSVDYLQTSIVQFDNDTKQIDLFETVAEGMVEYLGSYKSTVESCDLKYIFVQEIEIARGSKVVNGERVSAPLVGVEVGFLSGRDVEGYSYENWENQYYEYVYDSFEMAENYEFEMPKIPTMIEI